MASVNATSSPRDHAADANPGLARKKQRLSEEARKSPEGSVVIEALEPEDIGSNLENAIEIEDDLSFNMDSEPYSDDFIILQQRTTPFEQLGALLSDINDNQYIEPQIIVNLSDALTRHLDNTASDKSEWNRHYLEDEAEFFTRVAQVALKVMDTDDLFEPGQDLDNPVLGQAFTRLFIGFERISRRVIPLLPDAVKGVLARRDSTQVSRRQHHIGCLHYATVAARVLTLESSAAAYFLNHVRGLNLNATVGRIKSEFFEAKVISPLAFLIRTLGGAMCEVKHSWFILQNLLHLVSIAVGLNQTAETYPKEQVEEAMEVVCTCILPAVCEKHPRALPNEYHAELMFFGSQMLLSHTHVFDLPSTSHFYERFVKGNADAVLPESTEDESTETSLWRVCGEDKSVLALLLSTAWSLQVSKSYIYSDIMDIRNVGISCLSRTLVQLYHNQIRSVEGLEHPVIQYAVRFLRKNEITAYIFGPQSRAGLLHHSKDIIGFLAATSTYTNLESDIIWQACSTSVEADFVKASFGVLASLMQYLDFAHLLHLVEKISRTPVDKIGSDAVCFLPALLKQIEEKCRILDDPTRELEVAFACLDILKQANLAQNSASSDHLRQISMVEIARFANPNVAPESKVQIYERCIPEVLSRSKHATTGWEVLQIFLNVRISSEEAQHILNKLPVRCAVDELCHFVSGSSIRRSDNQVTQGAIVRLECIARLMAFSDFTSDRELHRKLFDHAFGEAAFSSDARNAAWAKLSEMSDPTVVPSAATKLWELYMEDYVPAMSVDLATPKLVDFMNVSLKAEFARQSVLQDLTQLLRLPLWTTLVRFATNSTNNYVVNAATGAMLDLLFVHPSQTTLSPNLVIKCHSEFTQDLIRSLCRGSEGRDNFEDPVQLRQFLQGLNLLTAVLIKSKGTATPCTSTDQPNDIDLEDGQDTVHCIAFTIQVYGPHVQPTILNVSGRPDRHVAELLSRLPEVTGAPENRVISRGSEISQFPSKTLADARVEQSGLLMIRPKYTRDVNFDKVLTCADAVEREILEQYSSLEALLDKSEIVAQKVYSFLKNVGLSAMARAKIASTESTARDLFPPDRPWRTRFSLYVLQSHLRDFVRLGVVDKDFAQRSIHLLTAFVMDENRLFQPDLTVEVLKTLLIFLRERPPSGDATSYFEDDNAFVVCIMDLLLKGMLQPIELSPTPVDAPTRSNFAITAYELLLQACRTSSTLWSAFAQHDAAVELHRRLLLDADVDLSKRIMSAVKNFVHDATAPQNSANFYWRTMIPTLSAAMQTGPRSQVYFDMIIEILHADEVTKVSESTIRDIIQRLVSELWSYEHTETLPLLIADRAMEGLLRLLLVAVGVLRSHKKRLELPALPVQLMRRLLFPSPDGSQNHPLVHNDTRTLAYDLIRRSIERYEDYDDIVNVGCEATHRSVREAGAEFPGHSDWIRPLSNGVGLKNLGMTCYMNSLLQQLYGNLQFRKFILDLQVTDLPKQDILLCVQWLFGRMQNSLAPVANTGDLAEALGVQIGVQEDVHTFYTTLFSRLEDAMPDMESKLSLTEYFTGKSITQVRGDCGHVSSRTEPFTELSITIKNKLSLRESLDEFVQGEPLEGANKYKCMTCASHEGGQLVDAMRRTCLEDIPDNLTFCLKRFTYESMLDGENKVNDRFEFPEVIDMSSYKRSYLEDPQSSGESDNFELVGVIVHQGSLSFGHYWSYVRFPGSEDANSNVWMYLEDGKAQPCVGGLQEVQEQCFGGLKWATGNERPDNAYVLFYQRSSYINQARKIHTDPLSLHRQYNLLPRTKLPEEIGTRVKNDNEWQWNISCLFNNQFISFIAWLIDQYPGVEEARKTVDDTGTSCDDSVVTEVCSTSEEKISDLIVTYTLRIILADPHSESRIDSLMTSVVAVLEASPRCASHILALISQDRFAFTNIVMNKSAKVRSHLFRFIETCLSAFQESAPSEYPAMLETVVNSHASLLEGLLDRSAGQWNEYLRFAANLASRGLFETGIILDRGYFDWVLDVMFVPVEVECRKRHSPVWNWMKMNVIDFSPLFDFLYSVMSEHVDLTVDPDALSSYGEQRIETSQGWCLTREEVGRIFSRNTLQDLPMWKLFTSGSRKCAERASWKDYALGKLLGLFVGDKVHVKIVHFVENALLNHLEKEDRYLNPLLLTTLHYCLQRSDQECREPIRALSASFHLWDKGQKMSVWFLGEAVKLVPVAIVDSIPLWATNLLFKGTRQDRQRTSDLLRDHLFGPAPLTGDAGLTASRMRSTRALFGQCRQTLLTAYTKEAGRGKYEEMIGAMQHAKTYLLELHKSVAHEQKEHNLQLGPEVQVEYDESRVVLTGLTELLDEMSEWESETTLPTRPHDVRKSVEIDSEDADTSDAEADELSSVEV